MLEARKVWFSYERDKPVIKGVDFFAKPAEVLGIIGPNGSGKTTLIRLLSASLRAQKGEIKLKEKLIGEYSRRELAKRIAVVPQETVIAFPFSALEVVLMGRACYLKRFEFERAIDLKISKDALLKTGCLEFSDRRIDELSGGERQRVILARALAQEPEILLLDEPTIYLDLHHQVNFLSLVRELALEKKLTVVISSHDLNLASLFCDSLILLSNGEVVARGAVEEVMRKDIISKVYDVELLETRHPFRGKPLVFPV